MDTLYTDNIVIDKINHCKPMSYPLYLHIKNYDTKDSIKVPSEHEAFDIPIVHCNDARTPNGGVCWFLCAIVDSRDKVLDAFLCVNVLDKKYSADKTVFVPTMAYNKLFDKHYAVLHTADDDIIENYIKYFEYNVNIKFKLIATYNYMVKLFSPNDIGKFDHYLDPHTQDGNSYAALLTKATELKRCGKYYEALDAINEAISLDASLGTGYYNLGKMHIILGEYNKAIQNFCAAYHRNSVVAHPNVIALHLGRALSFLDEIDDADFRKKDDRYFYLQGIDPYKKNEYLIRIHNAKTARKRFHVVEQDCLVAGLEYLKKHHISSQCDNRHVQ